MEEEDLIVNWLTQVQLNKVLLVKVGSPQYEDGVHNMITLFVVVAETG